MNIPMYNAMRRCVPIANLLLGVIFLRARPSRGIVISVLTITSGTLVAGNSYCQDKYKVIDFIL